MAEKGGLDSEELCKIDVSRVLLIQAWVRGMLVRKWMKQVKIDYQDVVSDIEKNSAVWVDWASEGLCQPKVTKKKRPQKIVEKESKDCVTNKLEKIEKESQNFVSSVPKQVVNSIPNFIPIVEDETGFNSVETQTSLIEVIPSKQCQEPEQNGDFLTGIDTTWADRKTDSEEKEYTTDVDLHLDLGSETGSVRSRQSDASESTKCDTQQIHERIHIKESTDFEPQESLSERSIKSNESVKSAALSQTRSDRSQRSQRTERSRSHRQQQCTTDEEDEKTLTDRTTRSNDRLRSDRSERSKSSDKEARSRSSGQRPYTADDDEVKSLTGRSDRSDSKSNRRSERDHDKHQRSDHRSSDLEKGQRSDRSDRSDDRRSQRSERSKRSERSSRSKGEKNHQTFSDEEGQRSHRSEKSDEVRSQRSDRSQRSTRSNKSNGRGTPERSLEREPVNMKPRHSSRSPVPTQHLSVPEGTKGGNSHRDHSKGGHSHRDHKTAQDSTSLTNVTSVWGSFNSVLESRDLHHQPTQSLPEDPDKLRELRKNVAMELLWVQQAIQSRKNYLRMKGQI